MALEPDPDGGFTAIRPAYWEAIVQAGGVPVLLPQVEDPALIDAFLERVDGFLMIGGDDLSPRRTGTPANPTSIIIDPRRERTDFVLLERLLARRMPTLAICLAFQELNVLHGGSLYQDLLFDGPPGVLRHYAKGGAKAEHGLKLEKSSLLSDLWDGAEEATVNSSHHQAIRQLGGGLRALGWSPDGLIEAISVENPTFFLGVQWHPERMASGDARQRKLFAALVQEAVK